jgi:hypothetical protein
MLLQWCVWFQLNQHMTNKSDTIMPPSVWFACRLSQYICTLWGSAQQLVVYCAVPLPRRLQCKNHYVHLHAHESPLAVTFEVLTPLLLSAQAWAYRPYHVHTQASYHTCMLPHLPGQIHATYVGWPFSCVMNAHRNSLPPSRSTQEGQSDRVYILSMLLLCQSIHHTAP